MVQIRGIRLNVVIRFKRICGFWVENIFRRGNSRERRFYLWLKIERGKNRNSLFFFYNKYATRPVNSVRE